jgi:oligopeptide transport system ATP-binding protein
VTAASQVPGADRDSTAPEARQDSTAPEASQDGAVPIIETVDVSKHFSVGRDSLGRARPTLKAVDGVSLTIRRGETLALVGETGSGKTTFGRLLLGLYRPTSGDIRYRGESILDRRSATARAVRRQVQGVFQDPYSSLNPTMTIGQSLTEVLKVHRVVDRKDRADRVAELLTTVGLSTAQASRRPHAFSGGERQRVGIARALAVEPEVVIADEPLSALDVSIQAQVLNLMIKLQDERGLTYLFVTHDLDVARHISQRTAVLYLGRVVEQAPTADIFAEPLHPYTQALVRAAPRLTTQRKTIKPALTGDIPNAIERPSGCHFHPRCPMAMPVCREREPALIQLPGGRSVTCHLHDPEVMAAAHRGSGTPSGNGHEARGGTG